MSDTAPQQPPPPPPPPSPPPTETSSRRMQGSGPLPQEDVMMHMSPHMPPPPPPDRPRVTISTSELGTQTQQSEGVDVGTQANDYKPEGGANTKIKRMIGKTKGGLKIIRIPTKPEEGQVDVPMGSGGYPPPPPPPGADPETEQWPFRTRITKWLKCWPKTQKQENIHGGSRSKRFIHHRKRQSWTTQEGGFGVSRRSCGSNAGYGASSREN